MELDGDTPFIPSETTTKSDSNSQNPELSLEASHASMPSSSAEKLEDLDDDCPSQKSLDVPSVASVHALGTACVTSAEAPPPLKTSEKNSPLSKSETTENSNKIARLEYGLSLGDRVMVSKTRVGYIRYLGPTEFASGFWVGIELDEPRGKNNGVVNGKKYFNCRGPFFGLFSPVEKAVKVDAAGRRAARGATKPVTRATPAHHSRLCRSSSRDSVNSFRSFSSMSSICSNVSTASLFTDSTSPLAASTPVPPSRPLRHAVSYSNVHSCHHSTDTTREKRKISRHGDGNEEENNKRKQTPGLAKTPPKRGSAAVVKPSTPTPSRHAVKRPSCAGAGSFAEVLSRSNVKSRAIASPKDPGVVPLSRSCSFVQPPSPRSKGGFDYPPEDYADDATLRALRAAVSEKTQHIDQLLMERDLERSEVAKAVAEAEENGVKYDALKVDWEEFRIAKLEELEVWRERTAELIESLASCKEKLSDKEREFEDARFRADELELNIQEIQDALRLKNVESLRLNNELEEQRASAIDSQEELNSLNKKLNILEKENVDLKNELESIYSNQRISEENECLKRQLAVEDTKIRGFLTESEECQKKLKDQTDAIYRLQAALNEKDLKNIELLKNLEAEANNALTLQKALENEKIVHREVLTKLNEETKKNYSLQKNFDINEIKLNDTLNSFDQQTKTILTLEKSLHEKGLKLSNLSLEREEYVKKLKSQTQILLHLQSEFDSKDVQYNECQNNLEEQIKKTSILQTALDVKIVEHTEYLKNTEVLNEKISELKKTLNEKEFEYNECMKRLMEQTKVFSSIQTALDEKTSELTRSLEKKKEDEAEFSHQLIQLFSQNTHIQNSLEEKERTIDVQLRKLQEQDVTLIALKKNLHERNHQAESWRLKNEEMNKDYATLENRYECLERKIEDSNNNRNLPQKQRTTIPWEMAERNQLPCSDPKLEPNKEEIERKYFTVNEEKLDCVNGSLIEKDRRLETRMDFSKEDENLPKTPQLNTKNCQINYFDSMFKPYPEEQKSMRENVQKFEIHGETSGDAKSIQIEDLKLAPMKLIERVNVNEQDQIMELKRRIAEFITLVSSEKKMKIDCDNSTNSDLLNLFKDFEILRRLNKNNFNENFKSLYHEFEAVTCNPPSFNLVKHSNLVESNQTDPFNFDINNCNPLENIKKDYQLIIRSVECQLDRGKQLGLQMSSSKNSLDNLRVKISKIRQQLNCR